VVDEPGRAKERVAMVVEALTTAPGVTHTKSGSRLVGASALKVYDKIFAMVSSSGQFVVKLPRTRVEALVASEAGGRFDASGGRAMKDWFEVRSESAKEWLALAREALEFVGT